ncbi:MULTISPECIES: threonine ammonia-lyase [Sulfurovum]|uniref:Threonine ammonia-lyase n=1 Tax=Sulfurovum xiamenensis TaxID=3019066 RepID=A0ABT7QPM5_9BACT|nr:MULTISPECIES: threonine ammonia-lyase [Sulfurovum]EIF50884.1 threonine dehydratase [Sulfurovum sp. AR]MDM5262814.1 threonine ammonia-lyase [Sulfurovum xiamenensis]
MLDLKSIQKAYERVSDVVHRTPFSYAPILSQMSGYEVYLKKENLQRTGAFKLRGAFNKIASLIEAGDRGGVVASSAGNHAQGVAFSAKHFGIEATIVMPESTPLTKVMGVKEFGANVILHGSNYDEAYAYAVKFGEENNYTFVHPFEDDEVMSGQGTVALEIIEEMKDLDAMVICVGGGGLISGMSVASKALNPKCKIIGISSAGAPAMKQSYDAKTPIDTTSVRTIADGIAVRDTSPITLEYILKNVDVFETVGEDEIAAAILFLLEKQKVLVEGAGAVGVAALLHGKIDLPKGSKVAVVLSGGNIDVTMLSLIIEKGLMKSARKMKLLVTLVDKPGALQALTEILTKVGANIVQIGYDRTSIDLEFGDANVSVSLETKGVEHQEQIREQLKEGGFAFKEEH